MRDHTLHSRSEWLGIFDEHVTHLQEACISLGYWDNVGCARKFENRRVEAARRALMRDITFLLDAVRLPPEGALNDQTPA